MKPSHAVTALSDWAVPKKQEQALLELDASIVAAVNKAKASGLPKGMIVALLQAHNFSETQRMVTNT
jgi:hypothetical protein